MPTEILPSQNLTSLPNGLMRLDGFDITLQSLNILVGQYTHHTLYVGNKSLTLPQGHTVIYVKALY